MEVSGMRGHEKEFQALGRTRIGSSRKELKLIARETRFTFVKVDSPCLPLDVSVV